jgi:hypothetical protein
LGKTLLAIVVGNGRVALHRVLYVCAFCVQVAQRVQRSKIARIMHYDQFIFADSRSNFTLRQVFFGISHCLCFVESHLNVLPQGVWS